MAIFNAWCDRVPMLILGATGPWDAAKRRPVDRLDPHRRRPGRAHPRLHQVGQPAGVGAGGRTKRCCAPCRSRSTAPRGPAYVNLDAALQEAKIGALPPLPDVSRFARAAAGRIRAGIVDRRGRELLSSARSARSSSPAACRASEAGWNARVALAEKLQARVLTDHQDRAPHSRPTIRCTPAPPATFPRRGERRCSRDADVVLSLDWIDLGGTLKEAWRRRRSAQGHPASRSTRIRTAAGAWTTRGCRRSDVYLMCEPDAAVPLLLEAVAARVAAAVQPTAQHSRQEPTRRCSIARPRASVATTPPRACDVCLTQLPLGWNGGYRHFRHPLDYLGSDGGGGVGAGPGITVGAALALKGSGRMPVGDHAATAIS